MVSFSVPVKHGGSKFQFRFAVQKLGVLFAGSRHQEVPQSMCKSLIQGLAGDGFSFWVAVQMEWIAYFGNHSLSLPIRIGSL